MPPTCTVCRLPAESRQKAEAALLARGTLRDIAGQFQVSKTALQRHADAHLPAKLVKAREGRELASAETLVEKLERYEKDALRLAAKAEKAGDLRTAAAILTTGVTRFAELVARLRGELQNASINIAILNDPDVRRLLERPDAADLLESAKRSLAISLESAGAFVLKSLAREYLRSPSAFVNSVRMRAAELLSERESIPTSEALAILGDREGEAVFEKQGSV